MVPEDAKIVAQVERRRTDRVKVMLSATVSRAANDAVRLANILPPMARSSFGRRSATGLPGPAPAQRHRHARLGRLVHDNQKRYFSFERTINVIRAPNEIAAASFPRKARHQPGGPA